MVNIAFSYLNLSNYLVNYLKIKTTLANSSLHVPRQTPYYLQISQTSVRNFWR